MKQKINKINGKKSYLIMIGAVIYAGYSLYIGDMDSNTAIAYILGALGLGSMRHGLSTVVTNIVAGILESIINNNQNEAIQQAGHQIDQTEFDAAVQRHVQQLLQTDSLQATATASHAGSDKPALP